VWGMRKPGHEVDTIVLEGGIIMFDEHLLL